LGSVLPSKKHKRIGIRTPNLQFKGLTRDYCVTLSTWKTLFIKSNFW
jgi:hypothetical protein